MAKRGLNIVQVLGNLGADPEMKYMTNGDAVCTISIATSQTWNDKATGEKKEKTEWHRIVAFRKTAELMGEWLKKGSKVYIQGRLQTRKWQDKDGRDVYTTEIITEDMQFMGGGDAAQGQQNQTQAARPQTTQTPVKSRQQTQAAPVADFDDDIPF